MQALSSALALGANDGDIFADSLSYISEEFAALDEMYNKISESSGFLRDRQKALHDEIDYSVGEAVEPAGRAWNDFWAAIKLGIAKGNLQGGIVYLQEIKEEAKKLTEEAFDADAIEDYAGEFNKLSSIISDPVSYTHLTLPTN